MATPTKVIQTVPIALQEIAASALPVSSAEIDVSTAIGARVYWDWAATANTATPAPTELTCYAMMKDSGQSNWSILYNWLSPSAQVASHTQNGLGAAGTTQIQLATDPGNNPGQWAFVRDSAVLGEWIRQAKRSGAGPFILDLNHVLELTHAAAAVWLGAERFSYSLNLLDVRRIKFQVLNNQGVGLNNRAVMTKVELTLLTQFG